MESALSGISPRPSRAAWAMALFSAAAVLTLSGLIVIAGFVWRETTLVEELTQQLQYRDFGSGEATLQELSSPPRLLAPVRSLVSDEQRDSNRSSLQVARTLVSVLSAVGMTRPDEAQSRLSALPAGQHEETVSRVQKTLDELKSVAALLATRRREVQESEAALATNGTQAGLIAKDFADIFGLQPDMEDDSDEPPPPYRSGVLEGLPRLKRLRDNIVDLTFLKVELDGLGASVKVEGSDPAAAFSEKVSSIRTSYGDVLAARERLEASLDALDAELDKLGKALQVKRAEIEESLAREIQDLVESQSISTVIKSLFLPKKP